MVEKNKVELLSYLKLFSYPEEIIEICGKQFNGQIIRYLS